MLPSRLFVRRRLVGNHSYLEYLLFVNDIFDRGADDDHRRGAEGPNGTRAFPGRAS